MRMIHEVAIEKKILKAVERISSQDLFSFGQTMAVGDRVWIDWMNVKSGTPVTLNAMLGLANNKISTGIGSAPFFFFRALYRCLNQLLKYLVADVVGEDKLIEICLDFAAPVGSPESIEEILPIVSSGKAGSKFFKVADIAVFFNLDDTEKKRRRMQLLELICLSKGMLPPLAMPGSALTLTVWLDGEKQLLQIEMPTWKTEDD